MTLDPDLGVGNKILDMLLIFWICLGFSLRQKGLVSTRWCRILHNVPDYISRKGVLNNFNILKHVMKVTVKSKLVIKFFRFYFTFSWKGLQIGSYRTFVPTWQKVRWIITDTDPCDKKTYKSRKLPTRNKSINYFSHTLQLAVLKALRDKNNIFHSSLDKAKPSLGSWASLLRQKKNCRSVGASQLRPTVEQDGSQSYIWWTLSWRTMRDPEILWPRCWLLWSVRSWCRLHW